MGVGNELRGDDGVGPYIADRLDDPDWTSINCGTVPENYTGVVKQVSPSRLLVVDAAKMDLSPGEYRILPEESQDSMITSTHSIPLTVTLAYLKEHVGRTLFVGVEPGEIRNSDRLSPRVESAAEEILDLLERKSFDDIKRLQ